MHAQEFLDKVLADCQEMKRSNTPEDVEVSRLFRTVVAICISGEKNCIMKLLEFTDNLGRETLGAIKRTAENKYKLN